MNHTSLNSETSLAAMSRSVERRLTSWQLVANLIGASVVTSYFVFFDRAFNVAEMQHTFYVVAIMFPVLVVIAACVMYYWRKDLEKFLSLDEQQREINAALQEKAQRKILDLPFMSAGLSFFNWLIAAITMTVYSMTAQFGASDSWTLDLIGGLRVFVGCIIGGIVVAAIIFFRAYLHF